MLAGFPNVHKLMHCKHGRSPVHFLSLLSIFQNFYLMVPPVLIGFTSDDTPFYLPQSCAHLFISYVDAGQKQDFFNIFFDHIEKAPLGSVQCFIAAIHDFQHDIGNGSIFRNCFFGSAGQHGSLSRDAFFRRLQSELNSRKKRIKKGQVLATLFILMDDVIQLLITNKKWVGALFLELLLTGHLYHIQVIAVSSGAYRNMLKQLMHTSLHFIKARFPQILLNSSLPLPSVLGAELVFTADDHVFFKNTMDVDYVRLYPKKLKICTSRLHPV
jgi:hypothetical protein